MSRSAGKVFALTDKTPRKEIKNNDKLAGMGPNPLRPTRTTTNAALAIFLDGNIDEGTRAITPETVLDTLAYVMQLHLLLFRNDDDESPTAMFSRIRHGNLYQRQVDDVAASVDTFLQVGRLFVTDFDTFFDREEGAGIVRRARGRNSQVIKFLQMVHHRLSLVDAVSPSEGAFEPLDTIVGKALVLIFPYPDFPTAWERYGNYLSIAASPTQESDRTKATREATAAAAAAKIQAERLSAARARARTRNRRAPDLMRLHQSTSENPRTPLTRSTTEANRTALDAAARTLDMVTQEAEQRTKDEANEEKASEEDTSEEDVSDEETDVEETGVKEADTKELLARISWKFDSEGVDDEGHVDDQPVQTRIGDLPSVPTTPIPRRFMTSVSNVVAAFGKKASSLGKATGLLPGPSSNEEKPQPTQPRANFFNRWQNQGVANVSQLDEEEEEEDEEEDAPKKDGAEFTQPRANFFDRWQNQGVAKVSQLDEEEEDEEDERPARRQGRPSKKEDGKGGGAKLTQPRANFFNRWQHQGVAKVSQLDEEEEDEEEDGAKLTQPRANFFDRWQNQGVAKSSSKTHTASRQFLTSTTPNKTNSDTPFNATRDGMTNALSGAHHAPNWAVDHNDGYDVPIVDSNLMRIPRAFDKLWVRGLEMAAKMYGNDLMYPAEEYTDKIPEDMLLASLMAIEVRMSEQASNPIVWYAGDHSEPKAFLEQASIQLENASTDSTGIYGDGDTTNGQTRRLQRVGGLRMKEIPRTPMHGVLRLVLIGYTELNADINPQLRRNIKSIVHQAKEHGTVTVILVVQDDSGLPEEDRAHSMELVNERVLKTAELFGARDAELDRIIVIPEVFTTSMIASSLAFLEALVLINTAAQLDPYIAIALASQFEHVGAEFFKDKTLVQEFVNTMFTHHKNTSLGGRTWTWVQRVAYMTTPVMNDAIEKSEFHDESQELEDDI